MYLITSQGRVIIMCLSVCASTTPLLPWACALEITPPFFSPPPPTVSTAWLTGHENTHPGSPFLCPWDNSSPFLSSALGLSNEDPSEAAFLRLPPDLLPSGFGQLEAEAEVRGQEEGHDQVSLFYLHWWTDCGDSSRCCVEPLSES